MYLPFSLSNPVSRRRWAYHNKPMDTLKVQMGLERLGFMEPREDDTYVSTDSDQLFGAMKDFQKANGLKVDGIANPDGPTHRAMNRALAASSAGKPARPLIIRPIPTADAAVRHKNQRDIRVLGKRSDPGDYPVLMAETLLSKNGGAAAPEVADLLGQIYARNPDMGRKARTELAGVVDETSMRHLDDAAKIPPEDREPPQRPKEPEPEDEAPGIMDGSLSRTTPSPDNSPANDALSRVPLEGGKYSDAFLNAIHEKESARHGYRAYNESGKAHGRYQLTEKALIDAGMMDADKNWTGRHGVHSREDFLDNPEAQEKAVEVYLEKTEKSLRNIGATKHVGQTFQGIKGTITVSEDGLLAAAHRAGATYVKRYLEHKAAHGWSANVTDTADEKYVHFFKAIETRLREFQDVPRFR